MQLLFDIIMDSFFVAMKICTLPSSIQLKQADKNVIFQDFNQPRDEHAELMLSKLAPTNKVNRILQS